MTTFGVRIDDDGTPHVRVRVWAGTKEGARGLTGTLVMSRDEACDLEALLTATPAADDDATNWGLVPDPPILPPSGASSPPLSLGGGTHYQP